MRYTDIFVSAACKINVHKRCSGNVSKSCGINEKQIADILKDIGKLHIGHDDDDKKHKVKNLHLAVICSLFLSMF